MGPGDLQRIISRLPEDTSPELLSSIHNGEDAGVFLLQEGLALVQTVDFFPPIVDDPYTFGQIAAANAMSDIYAMGAKPLTALNIVAFPCAIGTDVLENILLGGHSKVREAGAFMVGGHTIEDEEPKYGLAVTGVVNPSEMKTISGARRGDFLVLTKAIGTGVLTTALKGGLVTGEQISEAVQSMCLLNREAAEVFARHAVSACTDVTGFGLIGHLYEMARASSAGAEVWAAEVPLFQKTLEMASMGMIPEGESRNREYVRDSEAVADGIDEILIGCLYDPQTSGGLLAAVPPDALDPVLKELKSGPCPRASAVGVVTGEAPGTIRIKSKGV